MSSSNPNLWPFSGRIEEFPIGNRNLAEWLEVADDELRQMIQNCRYPWEFLEIQENALRAMKSEILGECHPAAVIDGILQLGKGSRILPGVYIEGNVVIGENCKIGPNCYIRGTTSIGDHCHIGQSVEIKNSILFRHTNVGHLSYVGDSILGEKVNLGAGTLISNFRHDGKNHRSRINDDLVDTGRRKLGAMMGNGVHTGIGTLIYPGRKIAAGLTTRPGEIVQKDLEQQIS